MTVVMPWPRGPANVIVNVVGSMRGGSRQVKLSLLARAAVEPERATEDEPISVEVAIGAKAAADGGRVTMVVTAGLRVALASAMRSSSSLKKLKNVSQSFNSG